MFAKSIETKGIHCLDLASCIYIFATEQFMTMCFIFLLERNITWSSCFAPFLVIQSDPSDHPTFSNQSALLYFSHISTPSTLPILVPPAGTLQPSHSNRLRQLGTKMDSTITVVTPLEKWVPHPCYLWQTQWKVLLVTSWKLFFLVLILVMYLLSCIKFTGFITIHRIQWKLFMKTSIIMCNDLLCNSLWKSGSLLNISHYLQCEIIVWIFSVVTINILVNVMVTALEA